MANLADARCFHHAEREAAARCLECDRLFCRECVTEYRGRVVCAACLEALSQSAALPARGPRLLKGAAALVSLFAMWFTFYVLGRLLLSIPSPFHEGTFWEELWRTRL